MLDNKYLVENCQMSILGYTTAENESVCAAATDNVLKLVLLDNNEFPTAIVEKKNIHVKLEQPSKLTQSLTEKMQSKY